MRKLLLLVVIIWLAIGTAAAFQRDYFGNENPDCGEVGTIALTIVAGPLNYTGLNPEVAECDTPDVDVPEPSR